MIDEQGRYLQGQNPLESYVDKIESELRRLKPEVIQSYELENSPQGGLDTLFYWLNPLRQVRVNSSRKILKEKEDQNAQETAAGVLHLPKRKVQR